MSEEQAPYGVHRKKGCVFCSSDILGRIVDKHGHVFAIEDQYPVTPGHLLVMPYRHAEDLFSMTVMEQQHAFVLLQSLKDKILSEDNTVTGFNIGMNCGESAGQTVMHAHIHLIPRREGDVADPRGGIRGCVPGKMNY
jgi:diadenosine tetraphosphate (Ap4A) HIT family hydrolase